MFYSHVAVTTTLLRQNEQMRMASVSNVSPTLAAFTLRSPSLAPKCCCRIVIVSSMIRDEASPANVSVTQSPFLKLFLIVTSSPEAHLCQSNDCWYRTAKFPTHRPGRESLVGASRQQFAGNEDKYVDDTKGRGRVQRSR
jgi:hypothetical protein